TGVRGGGPLLPAAAGDAADLRAVRARLERRRHDVRPGRRHCMSTTTTVRREFATTSAQYEPIRPLVMGRRGAVAAGHFLASLAGQRMFELGGNAIDAGVAAGVCINVLLFPRADFGGVAPMVIHHAASQRTVTLDGLGVWPALADI